MSEERVSLPLLSGDLYQIDLDKLNLDSNLKWNDLNIESFLRVDIEKNDNVSFSLVFEIIDEDKFNPKASRVVNLKECFNILNQSMPLLDYPINFLLSNAQEMKEKILTEFFCKRIDYKNSYISYYNGHLEFLIQFIFLKEEFWAKEDFDIFKDFVSIT